MSSVALEHLTVRFGEVVAVDDLSLQFDEGEFVVLLGPSGCGKTTTLRCIAGLERASHGRILFNGASVEKLTPKERQVAMVFQFVSLYPHLSVRENIAFPLKARGERGAAVSEKVDRIAEIFDLEGALAKLPRALPPGTWQKAALARAVVREPRVLLLDEPLSAIDEQFREEMRWELRHIQKELGTTTIHVTHDQREAMSLADRVVLMRDGRMVQEGPPAALYNDPVDLFAAHFIGSPSMNLIPARLTDDMLTVDGRALGIPCELDARLRGSTNSAAITVGIRPHHVSVVDGSIAVPVAEHLATAGRRQAAMLDAEIVSVSSMGRERVFDFRVGDLLYKGVAPTRGDFGAQPRVQLDPAHLLFFGADGLRIRV